MGTRLPFSTVKMFVIFLAAVTISHGNSELNCKLGIPLLPFLTFLNNQVSVKALTPTNDKATVSPATTTVIAMTNTTQLETSTPSRAKTTTAPINSFQIVAVSNTSSVSSTIATSLQNATQNALTTFSNAITNSTLFTMLVNSSTNVVNRTTAILTTPMTTMPMTRAQSTNQSATSTAIFTNNSIVSTTTMSKVTTLLTTNAVSVQNASQTGLTTPSTAPANYTMITTLFNSTTGSNGTRLNSSTITLLLIRNATTESSIHTTFDADPLFLPVAPVIPKKYNDRVLVPLVVKLEGISPIQVKEAILKITIPIAAGIIGFIIGLMLCLQSNWLPKPKEASPP